MTTVESPAADGRHLRRDRNRDAVVEALLEIYREGELAPGAEAIAARAGISARSLFRYFDDIDDLVRTAIGRQQQHLAPLYALTVTAADELDSRIVGFVQGRVHLLEAMGQVGGVARRLAGTHPQIAAELTRLRAVLRDQIADLFAVDLATRHPDEATATLAALDVLASWEAHQLMRHDQGRSRAEVAEIMASSFLRLLDGRS